MNKKKKRAVTLIEIMIVILLIGLIGGALAFNMRGSMDEGRAFKTKQNMTRIQEALELQVANGEIDDLEKTIANEQSLIDALNKSPMIKDAHKMLKDGWGRKFEIKANGDEVAIRSQKYETWERGHKK